MSDFDGLISKVVTQDGYILNMQRIPEGRAGAGDMSKRQPVLIQHGILVVSLTLLTLSHFNIYLCAIINCDTFQILFYIQIYKYVFEEDFFLKKCIPPNRKNYLSK